MANSSKFTPAFSIGYAYAQTEHCRDAVAARRAEIADPFEGFEGFEGFEPPAPAAEPEPAPVVPAQRGTVPVFPATDAQVRYAMSLATRKLALTTDEERAAAEESFRAMNKREISRRIDTMKAMEDAPKPAAEKAPEVTEGMYRDPATGDIYKVQVAHHGSGNLYAKKLVALEAPRVKHGKEHSHDFEYAPGAIRSIRPEWRMTRDEAAEWGRLYGACCKCGTVLTDERSIAAGIGPVCGEGF